MPKLVDRVVETTQTTGTGTLDLDGAQTGYRAFADELTSGDTVYYVIEDDPASPTAWELGIGTWTSGSPNTLSRDTVLKSSNSGNKISLASGTTYTVTGTITSGGLQGRKGADIASATTVDLDAATGDLVDVTGTTAITAITLAEGRERTVRFTGVLTLTHGASLVLPGAANIATAAGDFAIFRGYASGVVRCVGYFAAAAALVPATQAEMEAGTATNRIVTPGRQHHHRSAAKAWVDVGMGAGSNLSYNVASIDDDGTGNFGINFTTAFSAANFTVAGGAHTNASNNDANVVVDNRFTTSVEILVKDGSTTSETNISVVFVTCFGDQ